MNYKKWIEPKLKDLSYQRYSLESIPRQINTLEAEYGLLKAACFDATPVSGGTDIREERLIKNIEERRQLEANLKIVKDRVQEIESALSELPANERLILERFYIEKTKGAVGRLCEELGYEQAQIYRIKDQALIHISKLMLGMAEV